ncbi:cobalt ECF transporter T component CbiQ [Aquabacter sediminis]|uniref:cobalt ECF transporter T component CbiQ n=1 Tax=Aquabacter sediminis TaxID=3029197 RepID=UPI00237E5CC2|nr:cobalt ECF transporter T component CbiQ [Aquabacter sp. P-9]MDE1569860.1 cobalt ECF transporter T component CbiQ [Aquabacter sp. P-9]
MSLAGPDGAAPSVLPDLDPRTRLLSAFACVLAIISLHQITLAAAALLAALGLALASGLGPSALARRLAHMEGFMLVLLVLLPFTTPGAPVLELGGFAASQEGLSRAVLIVVKVNACAACVFALIGTLEPVRVGQAAARLGVPEPLVHLFLMMVRYVSLIREETGRLRDAMRARAFVPRTSLHTWRSLGQLCGMILVRALERAERVHEAMRCRGFAGRFPARLATLSFQAADLMFGLVLGVVLAGFLALEYLS